MLFPATFYDVPNQEPAIKLSLDRVSVYNQKIEVPFYDDLTGDTTALFEVKASVVLHANQRGIHMSRIEQAFQNLPRGQSITDIALLIARRIVETQQQDKATVQLTGEVIIRRDTAVTDLPSYNTATVFAEATAGGMDAEQGEEVGLGLKATIMSACPCMQTYSLDELAQTFNLEVGDPKEIISRVPIATHSQKGSVKAVIYGSPADLKNISLDMLYQVFGASTHLTSELLKRPDEYDMVRRAHMKPQFVEDVVRDVLSELNVVLTEENEALTLNVQAESYESIHGHDIQAESRVTLGALRDLIALQTADAEA